jgi:hypothetical protein
MCLLVEDPGLRNLGGLSASGIAKGTVAAMDTDGVNTRAASAIGKVSVPSVNTDASDGGVNAGAASGEVLVPSVNTDAFDSIVNMGAASCVPALARSRPTAS